jgi:hypothetical protein
MPASLSLSTETDQAIVERSRSSPTSKKEAKLRTRLENNGKRAVSAPSDASDASDTSESP